MGLFSRPEQHAATSGGDIEIPGMSAATPLASAAPGAAHTSALPTSTSTLGEPMDTKASKTRSSFKRPSFFIMTFGWFLGLCAGVVNTVCFRSWGVYASHVTGTTTAIGMRTEGFQQGRHDFYTLKEALGLLFFFMGGAFVCGLLIDKTTVHFGGKSFYGLALIGNSMLLVAAINAPTKLASACLTAAACGLQNAMCTSHFGAVVRTTHVTGTVTDIGSTTGRMAMIMLRRGCMPSRLNVLERAEIYVDARKLLVLLPMWTCFLVGGVLGAYLHSAMGPDALLVPAGCTFSVGLAYMALRKKMTRALRRMEQDRLSGKVAKMSGALERAASLLRGIRGRGGSGRLGRTSSAAADADLIISLEGEIGNMLETMQDVEENIQRIRDEEAASKKKSGEDASAPSVGPGAGA